MLDRLVFEEGARPIASAPNRADIACFVGFVARRGGAVPPGADTWLRQQGWLDGGGPASPYARRPLPLFPVSQVLDPVRLQTALVEAANGPAGIRRDLAGFLVQGVHAEVPRVLDHPPRSNAGVSGLQRAFAAGLNALLADSQLYDRLVACLQAEGNLPAIPGVPPQAMPTTEADLVKTNRALLVAAYPGLVGPAPLDAQAELLDIPVPIENWDVFAGLFDWDTRDLNGQGETGITYLGAAVRSFFAEGGRKCYVVRAGDPWTAVTPADRRRARLGWLLPELGGDPATPLDRATWRGLAHLYGLTDVSFVCLPDLADLFEPDPVPITLPEPPQGPPEQFVECSEGETPEVDNTARWFQAPRFGAHDYSDWADAVVAAARLARYHRECQVIVSLPIPTGGSHGERDLVGFLFGSAGLDEGLNTDPGEGRPLGAFVQLAYPWVRTSGSDRLPEGLEPPEGPLAGMLARNGLTRGTYRSAAVVAPSQTYDAYPTLARSQIFATVSGGRGLIDRVTLFGPTPNGLRLLSDVTASQDENYRPASVVRLTAALIRAARRLGEQVAFEPSGEVLWARLRQNLTTLLTNLLRAGALHGTVPSEAFLVRCDRSTMTQNDLDHGRVVAVIQFAPAAAIEQITVALTLVETGQLQTA